MFTDAGHFLGEAYNFLRVLILDVVGLEIEGLYERLKVDHISYKCEGSEEFEHIRRILEVASAFFYQSKIADRRIAYFRLTAPCTFGCGEVGYEAHYVELADRKPTGTVRVGFDHIEMYPTKGLTDDVIRLFLSYNVELKKVERPHHTTYDHTFKDGKILRITNEPLINKIKYEEMK